MMNLCLFIRANDKTLLVIRTTYTVGVYTAEFCLAYTFELAFYLKRKQYQTID